MTANNFGAAICTTPCIIHEVCTAISKHPGPKYPHLPTIDEEMRKTVAKVFVNSSISHKLRRGILPTIFQSSLDGGIKIPIHLIGDPAYPLVPYCMKEYESCSNN